MGRGCESRCPMGGHEEVEVEGDHPGSPGWHFLFSPEQIPIYFIIYFCLSIKGKN